MNELLGVRWIAHYSIGVARYLMWTGRIEDDRGKRWKPAFRPVEGRILPPRSNSPKAVARQRSGEVQARLLQVHELRKWDPIAKAGISLGLGLLVVALGHPASIALMTALFTAAILFVVTRSQARHFARLEDEYLTLPPVCLACGYELTDLIPEADDCSVCPECGAAWRIASLPQREHAPVS